MRTMRTWALPTVMLCVWLVTSAAHADGLADEAELAFQVGAERYRAGDYAGALQQFLLSNRLVPNRNVMYNIARAFEHLNQFPDAYRWYYDALEGETDEAILTEIRASLARIRPNVAILDVRTTPPGATIYIDRRDLGSVGLSPREIALDPGEYRVLVELPGHEANQSEPRRVAAGETATIDLPMVRIVGMVQVEADEGTTVHVDDEDAQSACDAPCTLSLPPGPHILYFHREGFRVSPQQVSVVAEQTARVTTDSAPVTGSVVVTADERDALVEIDGRPMGFTPAVVPGVPIGRRRVRVSLRGYEPIERTVVVREGAQSDLRGLRLVPIREVTAASRIPERIEDAPTSVSIITAQELDAFQYPTIAEAMRGTRGMAVSFDSTYNSIAIRGLGQPNDYGNRVLILSDGATLNDNILFQSFTGFDGRVDLGDVDRIEVVRGPGAVLYGTGAVSGVINLVTRPRDTPTQAFGAISTFDTVGRGRVGFQLRLGEDSGVWTSLSGAYSSGDDVRLHVPNDDDTTTPVTVREFDSFKAMSVAGRAWHGALTAQWFFNVRQQHIPTGAFGTRLDDAGTVWTDTRGLFEVRFEPRLSEEVQLFTRVFANLVLFDGIYQYDGENPGEVIENDEFYEGEWVGAETRLIARLGERLRVTVGGELQIHTQAALEGEEDGADSYLDENKPYQVGAGYAVAEWRIVDQLRATAGARVDVFSTFGVSVNPRLALIYKPTPDDILKLMGGRAFRAPSTYELLYNDGGITQVRADFEGNELDPETVYSAELEYTHRFTQEWSALTSLHFQWAESIIETVSTDPSDEEAPVYYRNSDTDVYTLGADLEVRREWRSGIMFSAMYGFLSAQYADDLDGAFDRRLPYIPEHYASFRGVVPIASTGAQVATRLTVEAPRRLGLDSDETTGAAVVTDVVLSGTAREAGLKWAVGVYNLFDWQWDVPATDLFASPRMPQRGRSFMAHLGLTL